MWLTGVRNGNGGEAACVQPEEYKRRVLPAGEPRVVDVQRKAHAVAAVEVDEVTHADERDARH